MIMIAPVMLNIGECDDLATPMEERDREESKVELTK